MKAQIEMFEVLLKMTLLKIESRVMSDPPLSENYF